MFALFCLKLLLITAHEAVSKRCVQAETIISTLSPTKAKFVTLIASEDIWISRSVSLLRVGDS